MSRTKSQAKRRSQADAAVEFQTAVEAQRKSQKNTMRSHMIEVMRSQDSVTACAVPIFAVDASVLADALALSVAERRTDMSQVMD